MARGVPSTAWCTWQHRCCQLSSSTYLHGVPGHLQTVPTLASRPSLLCDKHRMLYMAAALVQGPSVLTQSVCGFPRGLQQRSVSNGVPAWGLQPYQWRALFSGQGCTGIVCHPLFAVTLSMCGAICRGLLLQFPGHFEWPYC